MVCYDVKRYKFKETFRKHPVFHFIKSILIFIIQETLKKKISKLPGIPFILNLHVKLYQNLFAYSKILRFGAL